MTLTTILQAIRQELNVKIADRAKQLEFPSGREPGLRNPNNGGYLTLRDDGVAEIGNGPNAAVLVDGAQGQVTVRGNAIALQARYLHLFSDPESLYFGYQPLNPTWFSAPYDFISPFWKAPLIGNLPESWEALAVIPFVTGVPDALQGQDVTFLGEFLHPEPLLGVNEQFLILGRNIAQLVRQLAGF